AALLKPMGAESGWTAYVAAFATLLLTVLYASLAGNSGVMQSAQLQLGMLYLGLFGSAGFLLYLNVFEFLAMSPHGTLAVAFVAVCCAVIPYYRRSKFVDTSPLAEGDRSELHGESRSVRLLRRFEKIFNSCLSVIAVLVIVIVVMQFYAEGIPAVL